MRRLILYAVIIFQILLITSLIRNIQLAINAKSRVTNLEAQKDRLVEEKERLSRDLAYVESEAYTEKVAREELQLAKPGETVVIVPEDRLNMESKEVKQEDEPAFAIWQKWWRVVSGQEAD